MSSPKVSIITAVFNGEATIARTIDSVLSQTYSNIEYILIDGNSKDKTLEIVSSYRSKISKIFSEPDRGIYDALNKGLKHSSGEIVGFLHADDFFAHSKAIEKVVSHFLDSSADGVYSDLDYVHATSQNQIKVFRHWKSRAFEPRLIRSGWMPPHPTLYLKKSVYQLVGNFDLNYSISADYDFILRVFSQPKLKFHYIPEVLVKMQLGGVSNRNLKKIIEKSKQDYDIIKKRGHHPLSVLMMKNLSKISQFFMRK